ncbi:hypothetical protein C8J57DRAFT_1644502 [Mycena rebaudengoi]|nr:hypothetical protein C8J57DRAFT_1644502 [Mycena rebaudengoi]
MTNLHGKSSEILVDSGIPSPCHFDSAQHTFRTLVLVPVLQEDDIMLQSQAVQPAQNVQGKLRPNDATSSLRGRVIHRATDSRGRYYGRSFHNVNGPFNTTKLSPFYSRSLFALENVTIPARSAPQLNRSRGKSYARTSPTYPTKEGLRLKKNQALPVPIRPRRSLLPPNCGHMRQEGKAMVLSQALAFLSDCNMPLQDRFHDGPHCPRFKRAHLRVNNPRFQCLSETVTMTFNIGPTNRPSAQRSSARLCADFRLGRPLLSPYESRRKIAYKHRPLLCLENPRPVKYRNHDSTLKVLIDVELWT